MESEKIKSLSPRLHILARPNTYLGGMMPTKINTWVMDEDSISYKEVEYSEGLLKIINEVIDNSVDEFVKTNGEYSTKISVDLSKTECSISDNGRGISTEKDEEGVIGAVRAATIPMSGSNFDDDANRKSIGMNGLGLKGSNIFSKYFECITCDGKGKIKIVCKNNMEEIKVKELALSDKRGTQVKFQPDFEKFGSSEFTPQIFSLIKTRLKILSWFYPKCTFTFNGEKINIKAKEIATLFPQPSVALNAQNVYICIYPSDEPYFLSYVNGISLRNGGTHVDYILNKVISDIRDKVGKKYKSIKPADIRNRLGIVCFFKDFSNCTFDSQTKEKLTNSAGDISNYLNLNAIDLDKFTARILKQKEIIDNITDLFRLKEELAEKKELNKLNKSKKTIDPEKYVPPLGKTEKKYLMLIEGNSAYSGISPILGRKNIGYYKLKGKILNVLEEKTLKIMSNDEINDLVNILNLDITNPDTDMSYEKVVILTDADADGNAIAGLVLTLFSRIAPRMLKEGRICRFETPLLTGSKNGKIVEYYFQFPEKSKMKKDLEYFYLKGLGSWTRNTLSQVLAKEGGMDGLIHPYEFDENAEQAIKNWFGSSSAPRKEKIRGREFHIDNA